MIKNINWEKVGVYIAVFALVLTFASKVLDLSERISHIEGKLEILMEDRNKQ